MLVTELKKRNSPHSFPHSKCTFIREWNNLPFCMKVKLHSTPGNSVAPLETGQEGKRKGHSWVLAHYLRLSSPANEFFFFWRQEDQNNHYSSEWQGVLFINTLHKWLSTRISSLLIMHLMYMKVFVQHQYYCVQPKRLWLSASTISLDYY